jgi:hypothetical protein
MQLLLKAAVAAHAVARALLLLVMLLLIPGLSTKEWCGHEVGRPIWRELSMPMLGGSRGFNSRTKNSAESR